MADLNRSIEAVFRAVRWRKEQEKRETVQRNFDDRWMNQDAKAEGLIRDAQLGIQAALKSRRAKEVQIAFFLEEDLVVPANKESEWKGGGWKNGPDPEWLKQPYRRVFKHFVEPPMRCVIRPGNDPKTGTEGWLIVVGW